MPTNKYAPFYAISAKLMFDADMRQQAVLSYTDGRTIKLTEMTGTESKRMRTDLNKKVPQIQTTIGGKIADNMRKKIIALCREMGMEKQDSTGSAVANMSKVYAFVKKIGYGKKNLNNYTQEELPKLVSQIEIIHKEYIEKGKAHEA